MHNISRSVGRDGSNQAMDVRLIQTLLNQYKIPGVATTLKVDGKVGNLTLGRIEIFQKKVMHIVMPSGRIDPYGKGFKKLANRPGAFYPYSYNFSKSGRDLLKSIEELALKPYDDQTGKDISNWVKGATIGYGHLIAKSEWNKYKGGVTEEEALSLFKRDLAPFEQKVRLTVKVPILQNEFDALVILAYNIGKSAFESSSVLKLVNNPSVSTSYPSLEVAWKAWNKSNGKVMKGLSNRRQTEWDIYTNNIYKKW